MILRISDHSAIDFLFSEEFKNNHHTASVEDMRHADYLLMTLHLIMSSWEVNKVVLDLWPPNNPDLKPVIYEIGCFGGMSVP